MDQPLLPADAILAALHWRYATKKFDPAKKLSAEQWDKLEQTLLLAPSSYGMQPYKFIVVTDPALREQLKAAAHGQSQITDCSHLVVFAARTDVTEQDVDHYMERISEVRGVERRAPRKVTPRSSRATSSTARATRSSRNGARGRRTSRWAS